VLYSSNIFLPVPALLIVYCFFRCSEMVGRLLLLVALLLRTWFRESSMNSQGMYYCLFSFGFGTTVERSILNFGTVDDGAILVGDF